MNHDESGIQMAICEALDAMKIFYFSVPNEAVGGGSKAARRMTRYKKQGLRAGMADLCIVDKAGRVHFMEVKTPTGRMSQAQKDMMQFCNFSGYDYEVVRSVDDALDVLRFWEII